MASDQDTQFPEHLRKDTHDAIEQPDTHSGERIGLWLAGSIIFFMLLVFAISALIVQRVYFQPPVVRTAVERELIKYRNAIKHNPRDAEAYVGLAGVYLEIEQPSKAVEELSQALALDPRSWNAHFELAMAYDALNQSNDAIGHLWNAAAIDPNNELAFYQLGKLYQKQKLYGQAIQSFKRTLRINPTLADAHYFLGRCYESTNKKQLAKSEYREALRYVDQYPEAAAALKRLQ